MKRDGWRAYVFRQDDHAVAAVWTNERQVELGRKKGRALKLSLPNDVCFVDLMGNPRSVVSRQSSVRFCAKLIVFRQSSLISLYELDLVLILTLDLMRFFTTIS